MTHTSSSTPRPSENPGGIGRRGLFAGAALAGIAAAGSSLRTAGAAHAEPLPATRGGAASPLRFPRGGKARIVQFNDTQDGHLTDRRTIQLMEKVLDTEKPLFALINGDVVNGDPATEREAKQAYNNVVRPMEERGIKWAITFGNHDEDAVARTGMTEQRVVDWIHDVYEHNLNPAIDRRIAGQSNGQILIRSSRRNEPAFGIWLLDSNRYAPETIGGQSRDGLMNYDWIRFSQNRWYYETSVATEKRYGRKIPSLMFFHIPLWEHHHMWYGTQFGSDEATHPAAAEKHGIVGEKHEAVYVGAWNSGLYSLLQERGDVRGVYCGHDHINTYRGDYYGIELGYGPGTGFGTYGLGGAEDHRLRGARVFELDENAEGVYVATRTVFARDLGIDTSPGSQPIDRPYPLP